jgi:hypothetical protein
MMNEYSGFLTEYYETGMESLGLILQDSRGVTANPLYDPTKSGYPYDIPEWYSISYALFLNGGEEIEVLRPDGTVEYKGPLTKDRRAMAEGKYQFSLIPKEVPFEIWIGWFRNKLKARVWSVEAL